MNTYARILDGRVVELFTPPATERHPDGVPITECFHPDLVWIECTSVAGIAPDWRYADGTFREPDVTVDRARLARQARGLLGRFTVEIKSAASPQIAAVYAFTPAAYTRALGIASGVAAGLGLPGGQSEIEWPDQDGTVRRLTADQFRRLVTVARDVDYALHMIAEGGDGALPDQPAVLEI